MKKILLAILCCCSLAVAAQDKITIITTLPPGTGIDTTARIITSGWENLYGTGTTMVISRPGADGLIAARAMLEMTGNTILFPLSGNLPTLPEDVFGKLQPLLEVTRQPWAVVVKKSLPASNFNELITLAQNQPGKLNICAVGSTVQSLIYDLERRNKVRFNKINYATMGPNVRTDVDLANGSLDICVVPAANIFIGGFAAASKPVAVFDHGELGDLPRDIFVTDNIRSSAWSVRQGMWVAANMDPTTRDALTAKFVMVLNSPEIKKRLEIRGIKVMANATVQGYQQHVQNERQFWQKNKDSILKDYQ